jgi:hypothetical protein
MSQNWGVPLLLAFQIWTDYSPSQIGLEIQKLFRPHISLPSLSSLTPFPASQDSVPIEKVLSERTHDFSPAEFDLCSSDYFQIVLLLPSLLYLQAMIHRTDELPELTSTFEEIQIRNEQALRIMLTIYAFLHIFH